VLHHDAGHICHSLLLHEIPELVFEWRRNNRDSRNTFLLEIELVNYQPIDTVVSAGVSLPGEYEGRFLRCNLFCYLQTLRETVRYDGRARINFPHFDDLDLFCLFLEKLRQAVEEGITVALAVPPKHHPL